MFVDVTHDPNAPELTPEQEEENFYRDALRDVTEAARQFSILLLEAAKRAARPEDIARLSQAFIQTSRAVRRGLLLARYLRRPLKPLPNPPDPTPDDRTPGPDARAPVTDRPNPAKIQVRQALEAAIEAADLDPDDAQSRRRELLDRLETEELREDFSRRPIPEIIAKLKYQLRLVFEAASKPIHRDPPAPRSYPNTTDHRNRSPPDN